MRDGGVTLVPKNLLLLKPVLRGIAGMMSDDNHLFVHRADMVSKMSTPWCNTPLVWECIILRRVVPPECPLYGRVNEKYDRRLHNMEFKKLRMRDWQ